MGRIANEIIRVLKAEDRPLSPIEIAKIIKQNRNSVRSEIRRLVRKGIIEKAFYGHYCTKPTIVVGTPPRLQNLLFIATSLKYPELKGKVRDHKEFVYEFSDKPDIPELDFRVWLTFGKKRDKINWTVKAPLGLDLYALLMARQWVDEKCGQYNPEFRNLVWDANKFEFLFDHMSVKLEGVSIITIDDLVGTMEKYYNKSYGVRHEIRSSVKGKKIEDLVNLVSGGLPQSQMMQGVVVLQNEIRSLVDAVKDSNRINVDLTGSVNRTMSAFTEAQFKMIDRLDKILKRAEDSS